MEKIMETVDDCFLNINWIDLKDNTNPVGFLCLYNDKFYFTIRGKEKIPLIYKRGFDILPGVQPDKIYVSTNELFNILKKRLGIREGAKEKIEIMKEVLANKIEKEAKLDNKRDRITFGNMDDDEIEKCKEEIDTLEDSKKKQANVESR